MNRNDNEPHALACAAIEGGIVFTTRYKSPPIAMGGLAMMLLVGFGSPLRADLVAVEGRPMVVGVQILELKEARLYYRLPAGREVSRPIADVKFLQITGWPGFNEAETRQRSGELRQAAAGYERVLAELEASNAAGKLDRALLVRCRLLRIYDAQGRFDRAVTLYLDVLERMPTALEALRPTRLPAAGSSFLPVAWAAIDTAIQRHRGTQVSESLAKWRATWPGQGADRAGSVHTLATTPAEPEEIRQLRVQLADIEALVAANQFDKALARIGALPNADAGVLRADLYYWQGRAWLGKSLSDDSPEARRDGRRAGLAFLRVVIHFPRHRRAPECLYRAGQICQRAGREDLARRLWSELLRSYPTDAQRRIESGELRG